MKIHWNGNILGGSGYASAARGYIKAMFDCGVDITCSNVSYHNDTNKSYLTEEELSFFEDLIQKGYKATDKKDRVFIDHASPNILKGNKNYKYSVAYSVWETSNIPEKWAENINKEFEFLLTASEYSKQAFVNGGVKIPIYVIPHVVEPQELEKNEKIEEITKNKNVVFLSIFEWHYGKGFDLLIHGYLEAFKNNPDVLLILKTNSFVNPKTFKKHVLNYIKEAKEKHELDKYPEILVLTKPLKKKDLYSLYHHANIFVLPSHREGFGLPYAEALMSKCIVMAPDKGGQTEFLNTDNAILFPSFLGPVRNIEKERRLYEDQQWVEIDYNQFVRTLKLAAQEIHTISDDDVLEFEEQRSLLIEKLSAKNIVNQFHEIIEEHNE